MAKSSLNQLLLAKIETTAGVDAVPAAVDAMLVSDIKVNPIVAEFADRNLVMPYYGNSGQIQVQAYSSIDFTVELAGSGAAGTAPKWGRLMQACGFSETLTASTKADYAPITTGSKTLSIYHFIDGVRHILLNCRGTVKLMLDKGIPKAQFSMVGFAGSATDTANPTSVDYSAFIQPLAINKLNTPTFTLHGIAVKANSLGIDMANQVDYRNYIGSEDVVFTDRNPTGNVTFEYDPIATKNWWTTAAAGTTGALALTHGATAGNIIQIAAPKVQLTNPDLNDDNNVAMVSAGLSFMPNAGNDELIITAR